MSTTPAVKIQRSGPALALARISHIPTMEVTMHHLDQLRDSSSASGNAFAVFTLFVGMLIPTLISWATTAEVSDRALGIYVAASISLTGISAIAFYQWWTQRRRAKTVYEEITRLTKSEITST